MFWQRTLTVLTLMTRRDPVRDRLSSYPHLLQDDLTKYHAGESSKVVSDRRRFWGQFCASYHTLPVWSSRLMSPENEFFWCFSFSLSVLESVGNTLRNEDQGDERKYFAGDITPLVWTDEETLIVDNDISPQNPFPAAHHLTQRNQNGQLQLIQERLSNLERETRLMNYYLFYNQRRKWLGSTSYRVTSFYAIDDSFWEVSALCLM